MSITVASPGNDPFVEPRRGEESRDDQLPHASSRRRAASSANGSSARSRDWECNCGKYKRIKYKGVVCDRCGVEVTVARVRRERMGHIELAVPGLAHLVLQVHARAASACMLDMTARALERVIYYED